MAGLADWDQVNDGTSRGLLVVLADGFGERHELVVD